MTVDLAYGKNGLPVTIPNGFEPVILRASQPAPLADPTAALRDALRASTGSPALAELVGARTVRRSTADLRAGIVFNDTTRATPN